MLSPTNIRELKSKYQQSSERLVFVDLGDVSSLLIAAAVQEEIIAKSLTLISPGIQQFNLFFKLLANSTLTEIGILNPVSDFGTTQLDQLLEHLSLKLEKLALFDCEIHEINPTRLSQACYLRSIILTNCPIGDDGFNVILKCLNLQLESLELNSCGLKRGPEFTLLKECRKLIELDLSFNGFKNPVIVNELLASCAKQIEKFTFNEGTLAIEVDRGILKQCAQLQSLNLDCCVFNSLDLVFSLHDETIESLSLSCCGIRGSTMPIIFCWTPYSKLKFLDLSNNPLANEGFELLLSIIGPQLETLNIERCWITEINGNLLKTARKMRGLNLSENYIEDRGIINVFASLCNEIVSLEVSGCGITVIPFNWLYNCRFLENLDLRNNELENEQLVQLGKMILLMSNIRMVYTRDSRISSICSFLSSKEFKLRAFLCSVHSCPRIWVKSKLNLLPNELTRKIGEKIQYQFGEDESFEFGMF